MTRARTIALLSIAGLTVSFGSPLRTASSEEGADRPAYVQLAGPDSKVRERMILRIMDEESWQETWFAHTGANTPRVPLEGPFPTIDFDHCMVVAIFSGESWNSDGETVESVIEFDDHIRLRFDSMTYQTDGLEGGVRVTPYGFFVIPRSAKRLVIEENVQGLIGRPPKWKVQKEFDAAAE